MRGRTFNKNLGPWAQILRGLTAPGLGADSLLGLGRRDPTGLVTRWLRRGNRSRATIPAVLVSIIWEDEWE